MLSGSCLGNQQYFMWFPNMKWKGELNIEKYILLCDTQRVSFFQNQLMTYLLFFECYSLLESGTEVVCNLSHYISGSQHQMLIYLDVQSGSLSILRYVQQGHTLAMVFKVVPNILLQYKLKENTNIVYISHCCSSKFSSLFLAEHLLKKTFMLY